MGRRGWATVLIGALFIGMILMQAWVDSPDAEQTVTSEGSEWAEEVVEIVKGGTEKIVVLHVDGVIADVEGFGETFTASQLISQMDQVLEDDSVGGVVLKVNSPGGTVVHSEEIYDKILELKKSGLKVGVSMGATAASGGYYIAAPADYIFAAPSTITGSIGVIFSLPNFKKAADWIGYSETSITSGKMKDIGNPLRPMTAEERQVFQTLVDESYEQFVNVIVDGRKLSRAEVLKIADGRIYSGRQAKKLKLVDQLGNLDDAIAEMGKQLDARGYKVVQYTAPFSFGDLFSSFVSQKTATTAELIEHIFPRIHAEPRLLYLYH